MFSNKNVTNFSKYLLQPIFDAKFPKFSNFAHDDDPSKFFATLSETLHREVESLKSSLSINLIRKSAARKLKSLVAFILFKGHFYLVIFKVPQLYLEIFLNEVNVSVDVQLTLLHFLVFFKGIVFNNYVL